MKKKAARLRRASRGRHKMRELLVNRLCVNRTLQHTYAQIFSVDGSKVLVQASTLDQSIRDNGATSNMESAAKVGSLIAKRAKSIEISEVAFDRSGFKYHGRVKVLADAARANGLKF
jgi:large subunit ribosomal protein L18